jgi:hypothetical protein
MYTDRLRPMVYTSPSGQVFQLLFDQVSEESGKKAPETEFPGRDIGQVQDLGQRIRKYPVECYLSGTDYDTEADRLRQALSESGPGTLEHPRYGDLSVLPINVTVVEDFVQGAGRASFSIDFIEFEITQTFPRINFAPTAELQSLADNSAILLSESVADIEFNTEEKRGLVQFTKDVLNGIKTGFSTVTGLSQEANNQINGTVNKILREIDSLVLAPAEMMESLLTLYRLPARIELNVEAKINGYQAIYRLLRNGFIETSLRYGSRFARFNASQLGGILIGASESVSIGPIPTRKQALTNMERLALLRGGIIGDIQNSDYDLLNSVTGVSITGLQSLIRQSLSLPTEQIIRLDSDKNPLALTYELYGSIDNLELLIEYNNLTGDEILLIPRGREIRYYEPS